MTDQTPPSAPLTAPLALPVTGSRLTVVMAPAPDGLERSRHLLAQAERQLLLQRVFFEAVERVGDPADELIKTTLERDADLLIIGNGRTRSSGCY